MKKTELKAKIKTALAQALTYLVTAKVIFISTLITFIMSALIIYLEDEIWGELTQAFLMATAFTIPATLVTQKLKPLKKYLLQILAAGVGFVIGFFSQRGFGNDLYKELYYFGILCALILIILYLFIPKENSRTYFALVFKHTLFTIFMTLILMGGLCLLIYALQNLIFNTDDYDIYECCSLFCAIIFGINIFCYYLFYRRQDESSGKAFKVIALYILFPVFIILLLILYVYLIKALVLLKLPNGQINWFVSFASCFYIVFYFILREYKELPVVKFFYRFGAFPFIPLIIIQIYAYILRVSAYGFTGYRYSSLLFIIFSIITIALTFIRRGKYSRYALLILTALVLFDSVTPFNLIKMAHKSQFSRMMKVLNKYDLFDSENNTLATYDNDALEKCILDEDRAALLSSYRYLAWTSSVPMPDWAVKIEHYADGRSYEQKMDFVEVFGIKTERTKEEMLAYKKDYTLNSSINIEGYKRMTKLSASDYSSQWVDNKYTDYAKEIPDISYYSVKGKKYDLTEFFFSLSQEDKNRECLWYKPDDSIAFCFTSIEYNYNKERRLFKSYSYSGYVFYK